MALKMNGIRIVGTIDNLQDKLEGKLPVTREDLIYLISSWGRKDNFESNVLKLDKCEPKECYDLSKLNTSKITNMASIFVYSLFNGDISNWNTSKVTNMNGMFYLAEKFNQPLNFDTSKVTSMQWMFYYAPEFNQELNFDTSNVTNMQKMFYSAYNFNQPLNWNTSKVTSMEGMFCRAKEFNQPVNFDTSNVTNMEHMFSSLSSFIEKYNGGEPLPKDTESIKEWLNNHREKTNEIKADTINSKLDNNKNEFEQLIKEKNIPIDSKLYKELLNVYNQTQDKLKNDLDELKSKVVDIATKDFANIHL